MRRRLLRRLLASSLIVALGLPVMEAAVRMMYGRGGMHYGIEMWKYAKLVKRRSQNPDMSHEHTPGAEARLMGVDVTINSRGLRDYEHPLSEVDGAYRILVLGDSITLGWGVAMENTYCKVLERMLNERVCGPNIRRYEVINAGVGNYNTAQEVAYFKERGILYEPDMVILGFYVNDAEETPAPSGRFLAAHSYLYVLASSSADAVARKLGWKESYVEYYHDLYSKQSTGWQQCRAAVSELGRLCREHRIRLLIVLIPELHGPGDGYAFEGVHQTVSGLAADHGISLLDLQHAFDGVPPRTLWVSDGDAHPNATAHAVIAREISSALGGWAGEMACSATQE